MFPITPLPYTARPVHFADIGTRPLHGVMSGTRIRQNFAKKWSLHGVNEHFSQNFNAIIVPRSSRAKVSKRYSVLVSAHENMLLIKRHRVLKSASPGGNVHRRSIACSQLQNCQYTAWPFAGNIMGLRRGPTMALFWPSHSSRQRQDANNKYRLQYPDDNT